MSYKVNYKVENLMDTAPLGSCLLEGEIGARFDRFISERVSGKFAVEEILREAVEISKTAPVLIEARIDKDINVLPMVPAGKSITEPILEINTDD